MNTDAVTQQKNWNGKPYHSLDHMLRERFGEKVYKVTLNGGMSCPNRDGKLGSRGCIFCSAGGSGDFAADAELSVTEQIDSQIALLSAKRPIHKYIAYFQAYTNTYAPVEYLRKIFTEALAHPSVVALSIGTRPDCLGEDVLELLNELNQRKPVWVELGLQTMHERTAAYIRRGYPLSCFEDAVQNLRKRQIEVIVHTILGLPGESEKDILETMQYLNGQDIQGIKLQLLHVLKGTDLAEDYVAGGDARSALNAVELGILTTPKSEDGSIHLTLDVASECIQKRVIKYDKKGDNHYDIISAFIKSMRGSDPDAAVYYLAKMLYAGEDVKFIARRIMILASEDIGNADPQALQVAVAAAQAVERVGMPESQIILSQAVTYMACAPKSNAAVNAIFAAMDSVKHTQTTVPVHLQDAHYGGHEKLGKGIGYKYAHDYPDHYVEQQYLPSEIEGSHFYEPGDLGYEKTIKEYLQKIKGRTD
jgi:uncharacterized protein